MLESNKCPKCNNRYEVVWDESSDSLLDEDVDVDPIEEDESFPQYCPFCGIHREYGGEEDSDDDY